MKTEDFGNSKLLNLLFKPAGFVMGSRARQWIFDPVKTLRNTNIQPGQTVPAENANNTTHEGSLFRVTQKTIVGQKNDRTKKARRRYMICRELTRRERLAAEYYGYSLANYADHVEIGNVRFTRMMPDFVEKLERAEAGQWPVKRIAEALDVPKSQVPEMLTRLREIKEIVDAPNPSESFRIAVRQQIENAMLQGLDNSDAIDELVIQICFSAADLGCLLEWEGKELSEYSHWLRREKDVDYTGIGLPNLDGFIDEEEL